MDKHRFRQINYHPLHLSDCVIMNRFLPGKAMAFLIFDDPAYNVKTAMPKQTDIDQIGWWTDSQQGLSQWLSDDASIVALAPIIYPDPVVFLEKTAEHAE